VAAFSFFRRNLAAKATEAFDMLVVDKTSAGIPDGALIKWSVREKHV